MVFSWSSSYKTKVVAAINRTPDVTHRISVAHRVLYSSSAKNSKTQQTKGVNQCLKKKEPHEHNNKDWNYLW